MKLIDKLYLHLYWCGNLGRGGGLIDLSLERIFIFPFFGILMTLFAIIFKYLHIDIGVGGLVILSGVLSYFLADRFVGIYFTNEKRRQILKDYKKPNGLRYLVLIGVIFGGIGLLIIGGLISRQILLAS